MLTIDHGTVNISDVWEGYFLNHLLPEEHPNYDKPHTPPSNIDWKKDLKQGVYIEANSPNDVGFLWSDKTWKLYVNSESGDRESLKNPISIVEGRYHYGNFLGLEPKKQDLVLFGYYRAEFGQPVELKPYRTLRNPLKKPGAKEEIVEYRRAAAESYIKQRAKEIDVATAALFDQLGEAQATQAGLQQLNLTTGIETFFEQFSNEMFIYRRSGNPKILDAIASVMAQENPTQNAWLAENILVGQNADGSLNLVPAGMIISSIFQSAIAPVTQMQINEKAAKTNS